MPKISPCAMSSSTCDCMLQLSRVTYQPRLCPDIYLHLLQGVKRTEDDILSRFIYPIEREQHRTSTPDTTGVHHSFAKQPRSGNDAIKEVMSVPPVLDRKAFCSVHRSQLPAKISQDGVRILPFKTGCLFVSRDFFVISLGHFSKLHLDISWEEGGGVSTEKVVAGVSIWNFLGRQETRPVCLLRSSRLQ